MGLYKKRWGGRPRLRSSFSRYAELSCGAKKLLIAGQEIKAGMIEGMKVKQTYQQNEIQDGDVVCYQVEMTEKESV